ncbi:MAG: hypothetical protein FJZ15_02130 [Candidatus Omnitrophica bacterium]|nr:hypothetical protein [Candidatus Omnitrophota bacterium]
MQFTDLKKEIKRVDFDTLRLDCDNHFEAVILKNELDKLTVRLEKFFGSPAWPSKNTLSFEVQKIVDGYGGIMPGQILYFWGKGSESVFAMLWPWQDGQRTTVKIIKA